MNSSVVSLRTPTISPGFKYESVIHVLRCALYDAPHSPVTPHSPVISSPFRLRILPRDYWPQRHSSQSQQSGSGISDVSYPARWLTLAGGASMKKLLTVLVALGLAVSFMTPTFAAPKTKAECEKANMKWDSSAKTCS
jgi:hypothetical protein